MRIFYWLSNNTGEEKRVAKELEKEAFKTYNIMALWKVIKIWA